MTGMGGVLGNTVKGRAGVAPAQTLEKGLGGLLGKKR
jgi:hypothetical protein